MPDFILEYLPIIIVGAMIGAFTVVFLFAYAALKKNKRKLEDDERNMSDKEVIVRLLRYGKPYWKSFVAVFFIMLLSIGYDLVSPLLMMHIQDTVKEDFELSYLFSIVAVYAGILVISLICTYLQAMLLQRIGQKILSQIRLDVFTRIEKLSHEQLNNIPVGKLVT